MSLKFIPILEQETLKLFYKAKKKFVNSDPERKSTGDAILKEAFKKYLGEK